MPTEVTGRWEDLISRPELRGHNVKVTVLDDVQRPELHEWIEQAGRTPGWT